MSGTGNRRLIGWLALLLSALLVGGFLSYEEFRVLFIAILGVHS